MFGYDNVCSAFGRAIPPKAARCCKDGHTERRVNEDRAAETVVDDRHGWMPGILCPGEVASAVPVTLFPPSRVFISERTE